MRGHGGVRWALAAAAMVVVLVGVPVLVRRLAADDGGDPTPGVDPHWRVVSGAVPVNDAWRSGARILTPAPAGCFAGFGQDSTGTGMASGYWLASGPDCASVENIGPSRHTGGDSLPGEDENLVLGAVPFGDGGFLLAVRHTYHGDAYAYDTTIVEGVPPDPIAASAPGGPQDQPQPDRWAWKRLAEFRTDTPRSSHIGPVALAATGDGYAAVGHIEKTAVAWTSSDGVTWRPRPLPLPAGQRTATVTALTADGKRLVAVGTTSRGDGRATVAAWSSMDGGNRWRLARLPDVPGSPHLRSVVRTGTGYAAVGGVDGDLRGAALVLTSPDGVAWRRDDGAARAGARYLVAATALPGGGLLAAAGTGATAGTGASARRPDHECANAWHLDGTTWRSEPLGCHGVPTSLVPLGDGRVAGVHWSTLFLRTAGPAVEGTGQPSRVSPPAARSTIRQRSST